MNSTTQPRYGYVLGQNWRPGAQESRDGVTGAYVHVNSPLLSDTEDFIQRLMLKKLPEPRPPRLLRALRRVALFCREYRLYRRGTHSRAYAARIAFGIAFRDLPF